MPPPACRGQSVTHVSGIPCYLCLRKDIRGKFPVQSSQFKVEKPGRSMPSERAEARTLHLRRRAGRASLQASLTSHRATAGKPGYLSAVARSAKVDGWQAVPRVHYHHGLRKPAAVWLTDCTGPQLARRLPSMKSITLTLHVRVGCSPTSTIVPVHRSRRVRARCHHAFDVVPVSKPIARSLVPDRRRNGPATQEGREQHQQSLVSTRPATDDVDVAILR